MKKLLMVMVSMVFALASSSLAIAGQKEKGAKPALEEVSLVTVHATIEAIDKKNQTATLKGPEGETVTVRVMRPEVLDQVKVGDPVAVKYYESVAIEVKPAGEASPGAEARESVMLSAPGETPARVETRQVTVTATIAAIDQKTQTVTLKGPQGDTREVKVQDPKNLENVEVGDQVVITYTEAVAASLEKK